MVKWTIVDTSGGWSEERKKLEIKKNKKEQRKNKYEIFILSLFIILLIVCHI